MDIGDVMDELAEAVRSIPSLAGRSYEYPNEDPPSPAALVAYPEQINYDVTGRRGSDDLNGPSIVVVVGQVTERATRDNAVGYAAGSGSESIKAAIESHNYTSLDSVRVTACTFDTYTIADVTQLALVFSLDIIGSGTS